MRSETLSWRVNLLKVPLEIHAVVKHADNQDRANIRQIEDDVRALPDAAQARCVGLRAPAEVRIALQRGEARRQLVAIGAGLFSAIFARGVGSDPEQIAFRPAAEPQIEGDGYPRLSPSAQIASSVLSEVPLPSPSAIASRSAAKRV